MKFYEIDQALQEAVTAAEKPVRLRVQIDKGDGSFENVFEQNILTADFYSLKEAAGGVSSRGEMLISNEQQKMSNERILPGAQVRVSFSIGEGLPFFQRFSFYLDHKGVQDIRGAGRKRVVRLSLRDLSAKLRKTDEAKDWTSPAVFAYSVVCDKTQPERSLLHGIARRAGLGVGDIDCCTIPVTLPYARLRKNIWAELSGLATAYRCHLECAPEKPLVFAHSPYQNSEQLAVNSEQYLIKGEDVFYLRKIERADKYRNTVRLKINLPVALDKQEIWRYGDAPVFYDEFLQPHFPFKYPLVREIEAGKYEARYRVKDAGGTERLVIYADEIDTQAEAESRLEYDGGGFGYSFFDVGTYHDRAVLTLKKEHDGDLYSAAIYGKPIVLDLNRSCFLTDREGVAACGTAALNVTGFYFSEYEVNGRPQYEDWVSRELALRLSSGREFLIKTHKGLFNSRVGARVSIALKGETLTGAVSALHLRWRKREAFQSLFHIVEDCGDAGESGEQPGGKHDE